MGAHGRLPFSDVETSLALTFESEPQETPPPQPDAADASDPAGSSDGAPDEDDAPGVGEAIGGVRAAFMRMVEAHIGLLKAELAVAGKELGIIVAIGAAIFVLAILVLILLYVGSFLFLGDWLFGSMGWGIIHGSLLTVAAIVGLGLNLAGGQIGAYGWGLLWGLLVAVALSLLLGLNVLREGAVIGAESIEEAVPLHPNLLPTVVGLVLGALVGATASLLAGRRSKWQVGTPITLAVAGIVLGGFVGAILASAIFEAPVGAAIGIVFGLLTWIVVGVWLASRRGFDPEGRYANLVPRESMASFEKTKDFVMQQVDRQKNRMMGR